MKTSVVSMLFVSLAAVMAGPTTGGAQEEEAEPGQDVEREMERTVVVRPGRMAVFAGQRSWLGVRVDELDREAADSLGLDEVRGARVLEVLDDSPAAEAGLRDDDVIVGFDGEDVRSAAELVRLVRETPQGREVELRVVRAGSSRTLRVTMREREGPGFSFGTGPGMRHMEMRVPELDAARMERLREHMGRLDSLREDGFFRFHVGGGPRLGVQLESLSDQLAEYFGVGERGGVLVSSVQEGSAAEAAGLQAGDVIVAFGDEEIGDIGELMEAVHAAEAGPVTVTVVRRGEERSLTVELPERRRETTGGPSALRWGDAPGAQVVAPPAPTAGAPAVPPVPSVPEAPGAAPAVPVPSVPPAPPAPGIVVI